ncbi:MAG: threonine/serine exporter family protein [Anaerotignum sp.]|nr:threonine/serine exporter family protein [Anaerotignum sp.]
MDYDTQLLNLALDAGEIMLKSGAETYRVQDTMLRMLSVTGREKIEALALSTMLIVTLPRESKGPLSMARAVKDRSVNFEKICAVNAMSRSFVAGEITLAEATERLEEIHQASSFSAKARIIAYGVTACGFSLIYSGTLLDGIAAFFIGMLLGMMVLAVSKTKAPYFFTSFIGGLLSGTFACLFHKILPQSQMGMIIIGSIMPLLPGLTMTKAIRDLLEGNFISGNSKLVEAFLVACAIAGGVALALSLLLSIL